jgi:predicted O-methyltransferase YrrM
MKLHSLRPEYLFKRLRQLRFEKSQPEAPWLTQSAILLLDSYLKPTDAGIEWGSGRSTTWFARRVAKLISVENNRQWHTIVKNKLASTHVDAKVDYRLIPCDYKEVDEPSGHPYADASLGVPDASFDFALVDGTIRATCMNAVLAKIKPGGLLILDNANRFIPNKESGGHTTIHEPRSEPRSAIWAGIIAQLRDWRWVNTTDGIWDTRFWIKPLIPSNPSAA